MNFVRIANTHTNTLSNGATFPCENSFELELAEVLTFDPCCANTLSSWALSSAPVSLDSLSCLLSPSSLKNS